MISEYTRENNTFVVNTNKGGVKIVTALINHIETAGNKFKIKLQNGTQIGIYDMTNLSSSDVISFNSDGVVKFNVYDMNNNILPCQNYTMNDLDNNELEIPAQIMLDIA